MRRHYVGTLFVLFSASSCSSAPGPTPANAAPKDAGATMDRQTVDGSACATDVQAGPGTVITTEGAASGVKKGNTWSWKGIPYAAPPVGSLRFRPPQAATCRSEVLRADQYGPLCPQLGSATTQGGADAGPSMTVVGDEDCLTLDVWANEGLHDAPVMVFVHGGGNTQGSASKPQFEATTLAANTGTVVVTLEYRLGALGFLAATALNAESPHGVSGNYGILDQQAALAWVKRNAVAFGGSPDRVLLFGESAGAQDTIVHVASPLSKGLFTAAIAESGGSYKATLAEGITSMAPVIQALGCDGAKDVASCLRSAKVDDLVRVPSALGPLDKGMRYTPVVDGYVLLDDPPTAVSKGAYNHVPVILGTNADETSRMVPAVQTDAEYQAAVEAAYPTPPGLAAQLLQQYPASSYPSPQQALIALTTDATWTCPIRALARGLATHQSEPVFRYFFSWSAPGKQGQAIGSTHGIELPFVFQTFGAIGGANRSTAPSELGLSNAMEDYWSRLAAQHDPNGSGAVAWPVYDANTDPYLDLDTPITSAEGLRTGNCDFIDGLVQASGGG